MPRHPNSPSLQSLRWWYCPPWSLHQAAIQVVCFGWQSKIQLPVAIALASPSVWWWAKKQPDPDLDCTALILLVNVHLATLGLKWTTEASKSSPSPTHLAGACFCNFPCRIKLQFYAASGLEYGLPVLVHEPAVLLCKKPRNDYIEAISNCPFIYVHQLLLINRRAAKLALIWNLTDLGETHFHLSAGLLGPILILKNDLDISKMPSMLRLVVYVSPVMRLRWSCIIVSCIGFFVAVWRQQILLWILHQWRINLILLVTVSTVPFWRKSSYR